MLADEYPEHGVLSPATIGGTPVSILLYVGDVKLVKEFRFPWKLRATMGGGRLRGARLTR
jgi:hypothetical protein